MGDRGTQSLLQLIMNCCPYLQTLDMGSNNLGLGMSGNAASVLETMLTDESVPLHTLSLVRPRRPHAGFCSIYIYIYMP